MSKPQEAEESEYFTTEELAQYLKVPAATISQWRYKQTGPVGYTLGRHVRYRRADVERWLASLRDDERGDNRTAERAAARYPSRGADAS